jgi:glycosyltransferase involved in cell wall biosynthesis
MKDAVIGRALPHILCQGQSGGIKSLTMDLVNKHGFSATLIGTAVGLRPRTRASGGCLCLGWLFPLNYILAVVLARKNRSDIVAAGFWPLVACLFLRVRKFAYWDHGPQQTFTKAKRALVTFGWLWSRAEISAFFCSAYAEKYFTENVGRIFASRKIAYNWTYLERVPDIQAEAGLLVCLSRLDQVQKDVLSVVRAFDLARQKTPSLRLIICGDGADRSVVAKEITRRGLPAAISMMGNVSNVSTFIQRSAAVIVPGKWEGQSVAVIEALRFGRVPIATDIPPNREMLGEQLPKSLFPGGDVERLADAMIQYAILTRENSDLARNLYESKFATRNSSKLADELLQVFAF